MKVFVDTAAVMEKPLAEAAGLGWQGKHTNLVSRQYGSWLFLGAIFTTLDLPPDAPEPDHCGSCRACLDVCPTAAFPAPYRLDARRCISYLTIEHKGPIPRELRPLMGNRIYGCDDCLAVCPWNKFAQSRPRGEACGARRVAGPALAELARLDDAAFRALFSKSPIKRTGRDRFVRNVLIAIGNSRRYRAGAGSRAAARRRLAAGARRGRLGAEPAPPPERFAPPPMRAAGPKPIRVFRTSGRAHSQQGDARARLPRSRLAHRRNDARRAAAKAG